MADDPPPLPLSTLASVADADALVSIALGKLTDVLQKQLTVFAGAVRELEKLSSTFQSVQALLRDAESMPVAEGSVPIWLSELKHVCYDIDDVLDESEISGEVGDDGTNNVCACLFSPYNSFKPARRIKEIRERLDQIDAKRNTSRHSSSPVGGDPMMRARRQHLTTSLMDESESGMVIGRENDKKTMISSLVSGSSSNEDGGQVQVVAIAGIGGLGKTTLARLIYHDSKVRDHFNQDLYWVCVSEPIDVLRLTKDITQEVKKEPPTLSRLNGLQEELLQLLREKRYLLVLDDVWNDDAEKWEMLRLPLKSGANGSRILVTTRSEKVANTMNATYIHQLQGLSDDHSWELFRNIAFAGREAEEYSVLESVGKEIMNNCRVPLAIKAISSVKDSMMTVEDWKSIFNSEIRSLPQVKDKILPALLSTYLNLPTHLKYCFAYCSMFPKDWAFNKDTLVRLWVAQGFIWQQGNREIEDLGTEYFDELVSWSMFQQVQEDGETRYKMHGLRYDLAEFIFKDEIETSAENDDNPSNIPIVADRAKKLRTLWLHGIDRSNPAIVDMLRQAKSLRALSLMGSKSSERIAKLTDAIGKMRQLRYLDLSSSDMVELPNAIGKMKQLKYLNLPCLNMVELPTSVSHLRNLHTLNLTGCVKLERLPESVSHLRNLYTLNLTGCVKLKRLPRAMGGMASLRHLEIERTDSLECLPEGLGRIRGLRSLCKFIVGGGEEGGCQIDELRNLNSLQGILRIQHLDRVSSQGEAEGAQLWKKPHLRRLVLSRSGEAVGEGLRPHEDLKQLKLFWYTGSKLPSWMQRLPCLRKLELCGCPELEGQLHHFGEFFLIKELMIRDCPRIKGIAASSSFVFLEKISVIDSSEFFSSGLPPYLLKLKTFEIRRFRKETLPDGGWERLRALQTLEIWNCDELESLPDGLMHLQSLENLIIYGCDKLERLPEGLGQLKKLKSLTIGVLKALTCLPDSLESLEHLEVSSCKKLESLPHGLRHLYLLG